MAQEKKAKQVASRVAYVEPNDIYGSVNGVPLTPNYEDLCIAFNLIVEKVDRFNSNEYTGTFNDSNDGTVTKISFGQTSERKYASFLSGEIEDTDGNTYLSTYFTDITYEDVKGKSIVEGLGVESINVSFESFYTPTVTMKFVDVRGASLFGREAAIHEQGKITSENVFGCFFTLPYPKFKLQIKGFYGKDVTYQLTCSNFKGNFNSTNGNFEFTVTFIGYNYALLTDIPFIYLVSAPFCSYEGRKYWDSHISTPQWLIDGKPMVSIHTFMKSIESHTLENSEKIGINEEDDESLKKISNERAQLNEIASSYNNFISALQNNASGSYILTSQEENNIKKNQLFLMYNTVENNNGVVIRRVDNAIYTSHEDLITKLNDYNTNYPSNAIDVRKYPNGRNDAYINTDFFTLTDTFDIEDDENHKITKVTVIAKGCQGKTVEELKNISFSTGATLTNRTAEEINKLISTEPYSTNLKRYTYLFDLSDLIDIVHNRVESLNEEYNLLQDKINKQRALIRIEALPFKPTVGNIFKMIMAHLETFIHTVYQCKTDIISSGSARSVSNLNVNIENTDVLSSTLIPPFPAVYSKGEQSQNSNDTNNDSFVLGWVGDKSHNFIEEKLVLSIWKAVCRIIDESKSEDNNKTTIKSYTIFPSDLNSANNPFSNTTNLNISALGGYLGIRAAQIFGLLFNENYSGNLTDDLISLIGRMDAYNYYMASGSITTVNMELFDRTGSQNAQTILKNIALCDESADTYGITYPTTGKVRHIFENDIAIRQEYNKNNRCPIFCQSPVYGDRYEFSRYYDENIISLIPSRLDEYENYSHDLIYRYDNGNIYFIPHYGSEVNMYKAANYVNRSTTDELFVNETEDFKKNYYNDDIFNIVTSKDEVGNILVRYEELKKGKVNTIEFTSTDDFTGILNKCWFVPDSIYYNFFNGYADMFTVPVKEYGFEEKNLFPLTKDGGADPLSLTDNSWISNDDKNNIKYTDNGEYSYLTNNMEKQKLTLDDIRIHQLKIYYNGFSNGFNIFGHSFYYMQNNKIGSETDAEFNDRSTKVKALMFLHTLKYNFEYIPNFLNRNKKNGGIEAVPYGYLLLIGGLLWRKRYAEEHSNTDPIIYQEGNLTFKSTGINDTLFVKEGNCHKFYAIDSNYSGKSYNVSIPSILGYNDNENWELDYVIENRLIRLFENFSTNEFRTVVTKCELTDRRLREENQPDSAFTRPFTAYTFYHDFVSFFRKRMYDDKYSIRNMMGYYRDRIGGFYGNYRYCLIYKDTVNTVSLMLSDDNDVQPLLKKIYYQKLIVIDSLGYRLIKGDLTAPRQVYVKKTTFDTYLNSFISQLQKIVNSSTSTEPLNEEDSDKIEKNKAQKIEIYYYLKNLYDKWIIQMSNSEYYSVENFFKKNFVFVDKFYRNIYNKVIINCDKLLDIFKNRMQDRNASLFSVISDIVQEHQCLFVSLADYPSFGNNDLNKDIEVLENAFRPISYNEMGEIRDENHFVVMYVGNGASTASEENYYRSDGFNINTPDDIPSPFKSKSTIYDESDIENRYGYNVPAFGVSFGRQNQSLFKNLTLNMDSPAMTEIAAMNLANVAELGSSHEHRVAFYGQDIFNIFKNYSYECEVEMMGDAQIQPLMYFQLLNVPMWHGAYMIKSVTHTMTPGNMITRFKGQKMSKYIQPFCDDYFINTSVKDYIDPQNRGSESGSNPYSSSISDVTLPESYAKPSTETVEDVLDNCICGGNGEKLEMGGVKLNENIRQLFNTLVSEIKMLPENLENETWSICISSAVRNAGQNSEHNYAGTHSINNGGISPNAIDLQVVPITNGKRGTRIKDSDKMFKVMDIIATNHKNEIGQLIFEGSGSGNWLNGRYKGDYNCLHISYVGNKLRSGTPVIFLSDNSSGKNFATVAKNISLYDSNVPPEYKAIAKKYYMAMDNKNEFRNIFTYYRLFDDERLANHFGTIRTSSSTDTGYVNASSDNATKRRNNPGNLQWIGYPGEIKRNSDQWEGVDYSGISWSSRFAVFKDMTYGLRALFINMNTQIVKNRRNTIKSLIEAWAPPHENDTDKYVKSVARATGVNPDIYRLTSIVNDREVCINIAKQIAINEGGITLTEDVINNAYGMATSSIKNK